MSIRIGPAIIAVCALLSFSSANAQTSGFYIAGDLGAHCPDRLNARASDTHDAWVWDTSGSWNGFVRIGDRIAPGWRIEIEAGYHPGNIGSILADVPPPPIVPLLVPATGVTLSGAGGHLNETTVMANVLFDVPLDLPVQPFVGAGTGLVHTSIQAHGEFPFCPICAPPPICYPSCAFHLHTDDTDDRYGWQALAGLSFAINDRLALDATWRYLRASGVSWSTAAPNSIFSPPRFKANYSDNSLTVGIRYSFDAPSL
jgi:opacity protein-like surface antigen